MNSGTEQPLTMTPVTPEAARTSLMLVIGGRVVAIAAALLVLGVAIVFTQLSQTADSTRDDLLLAWTQDIAARLTRAPDGTISLQPTEPALEPMQPPRYSVATPDRRIILSGGAAPPPQPLILPAPPGATTTLTPFAGVNANRPVIVFYPAGSRDFPGHARAATLEASVEGSTLYVTVVLDQLEPLALLDDPVAAFFGRMGWMLIPLMVLVLTAMLATFWAELQLLRDASQLAAQIDPRTTGVRLPEQGMPVEIYPLVRSVNLALDRLEEGFRVQRNFTADAAHELRTPLAVMRAQVDALADGEAARALRKDIDTMSRLVTQLLRIAQLDTFVPDPEARADLHAVAVDVATELAPLAIQRHRTIHLGGDESPVIVRASRAPLEHAVRNLFENALTHTPEGTSVEVDVGIDGSVTVRDFGPGVKREDRPNLFKRFWRGRPDGGGAGLGLAIVARFVEAHGGTVAYEDAQGGGSCFRMRLPVDTAAQPA